MLNHHTSSPRDVSGEVYRTVGKLVKRNCTKFRLQPHEQDITQDILVKLITPSPNVNTNYLQRFDPAQNSLEGFLSRLIYNYFCRLYSKNKHPVEQANSIDDSFVEPDLGPADSDAPHDSVNSERIYNLFESIYPHTSGVVYREPLKLPVTILFVVTTTTTVELEPGQQLLWRSVANIYRLMLGGFSQEEVASVMAVSKGWVSKQVHKIRSQPEIVDWAKEYGLDTNNPEHEPVSVPVPRQHI